MSASLIKLEMLPEHREKPKEEILQLLDAEVELFSKFLETIPDQRVSQALIPMERALIKTYLVHKFRERF